MGIAAHIARLRAFVGHELLVLPSSAVLALDEEGRVLLLDVLGGPDYEVTYPNGDRVAYVCAVYEASIVDGDPAPTDGELRKVAWFTRAELQTIPLSRFARALLTATGYLSH